MTTRAVVVGINDYTGIDSTGKISGCRFRELACETNGHGVATHAFLDKVDAGGFQISYDMISTLQDEVATSFQGLLPSVPANYPQSQTPQWGQANRMESALVGSH